MKQEIVCPRCKDELRKLFPTDTPHPGEYVKFLAGEALKDYHCDSCYADIKTGDSCFAFSIWADRGAQSYYPWEKDYIKESTKEDCSMK